MVYDPSVISSKTSVPLKFMQLINHYLCFLRGEWLARGGFSQQWTQPAEVMLGMSIWLLCDKETVISDQKQTVRCLGVGSKPVNHITNQDVSFIDCFWCVFFSPTTMCCFLPACFWCISLMLMTWMMTYRLSLDAFQIHAIVKSCLLLLIFRALGFYSSFSARCQQMWCLLSLLCDNTSAIPIVIGSTADNQLTKLTNMVSG